MAGYERDVRSIAGDLRGLGVTRGMVVMVHASLRRIGPVEGGADGLIDALRLAIGEGGTMLMVLGAQDEHAWVNERPEAERPSLLVDADPFDAATTPADPDVGVLAEVFRRRPESLVSDHPEGRFAAAGPLAARLVGDVPWNDYYAAGSPLARLADLEGHVLRLGADTDTTTLLHHAEALARLPGKRRVRRHRLVSTPSGPAVRVVETLDDEDGIVDYPAGSDYFSDILVEYLSLGRGARGRVGDAPSELIEATDLLEFGVSWMETHLRASR